MPSTPEKAKACLTRLREYRRLHHLCRECGAGLEGDHKTRCGACRKKHARRESALAKTRDVRMAQMREGVGA